MAKLTDQQKKKLPPKLQTVLERFETNPQLLLKLRQALSQSIQKVVQQTINHETFCDLFQIPNKLPRELLNLYGLTERELQAELYKVGFEINRMYLDPYYQSMVTAYLVGLNFDDKNIRRIALLLIDIRLWNGRRIKYIPAFCDPDVARYALNYEIKGNHKVKKATSVFDFLDRHSVPAVDEKYAPTIANNLDHKTEGLRKLIETNYVRLDQSFRSMKDAYYRVSQSGKKEIISGSFKNQFGDGDMVEARESFSGNIERLVDKMQKNAIMKKNLLMKPDAKNIIKDKFRISDASIQKVNNWLDDEDNHEEIKYFFELLFANLKPRSEADICKYDIPVLANMVSSSKKDKNLLKAKEILTHALMAVLGDKFKTLGVQNASRLRSMISYSFMIYAKVLLCKKV